MEEKFTSPYSLAVSSVGEGPLLFRLEAQQAREQTAFDYKSTVGTPGLAPNVFLDKPSLARTEVMRRSLWQPLDLGSG